MLKLLVLVLAGLRLLELLLWRLLSWDSRLPLVFLGGLLDLIGSIGVLVLEPLGQFFVVNTSAAVAVVVVENHIESILITASRQNDTELLYSSFKLIDGD